jgi:hypothetical protein
MLALLVVFLWTGLLVTCKVRPQALSGAEGMILLQMGLQMGSFSYKLDLTPFKRVLQKLSHIYEIAERNMNSQVWITTSSTPSFVCSLVWVKSDSNHSFVIEELSLLHEWRQWWV